MPQIKANGVTLEYDISGPRDGAPLLIINGYGSQLTTWPDEIRKGLADAGLRVVRFDNRDVGLSQKWDGIIPDMHLVHAQMEIGQKPDIPYTLSDMAADAAGLLDALGIESAHIMGGSMGGMIAQLVALEHLEKTRSLICIFTTTSDRSLPRSSPEAAAALSSKPPSDDRETVIAHTLNARRAYASTGFPFDEDYQRGLIARNFDRSYYPEGGLRQWAAISTAEPRTERLKHLAVPTLVLHGTADPVLPVPSGRHIAECVPDAEYHEIEGWGHDFPLAVIPILFDAILPFVARVEAKRREGLARSA